VIAVFAAAAVAGIGAVGVQARIDDVVVTIRDQRTRVETTQTRTQRSVAVPSDVLFAFDSARLTSEAVRRCAASSWATVRSA
jgi:outer membrane protein OmpA-like peptidoglycan-associated protein